MFSNAKLYQILNKDGKTPQFNRYPTFSNQHSQTDEKQSFLSLTKNILIYQHEKQKQTGFPDHSFANQNMAQQQAIQPYPAEQVNSQQQPNQGSDTTQKLEDDQGIVHPQQSREFLLLKQKMINLENMAVMQINRLNAQVKEKDEQIGRLLSIIQLLKQKNEEEKEVMKSRKVEESKEIAVQTEKDFKDQQIQYLKQAVVRHIRINKEITKRLSCNEDRRQRNKENTNSININSIEKLVKDIQI